MTVPLTYPGVYIEEVPSGVRTITGVATSIALFIGWAPRGPVGAGGEGHEQVFDFLHLAWEGGDDFDVFAHENSVCWGCYALSSGATATCATSLPEAPFEKGRSRPR